MVILILKVGSVMEDEMSGEFGMRGRDDNCLDKLKEIIPRT
jgi:hypothetical protein